MTALGIFLFIFAILFSIGLHEFGHFITAKKFGIKVEQFFIGFGPRLWSVRRGETEYGVKAIPVGGYVRIAGMNPFEDIKLEDRDRVFKAKEPWKRAIVLAAGSFTHFVVGLGLIAGILATFGAPLLKHGDPVPTTKIGAVSETFDGKPSPAKAAGLREGDVILSIAGTPIHNWEQETSILHANPGKRIPIVVSRNGARVTLYPTLADHNDKDQKIGFLGISPGVQIRHYGPVSAVVEGAREVGRGIVASFQALGKIFSPSSIKKLFSEVAGTQKRTIEDPTTVVGVTGQAGGLLGRGDIAGFLSLIAGFNIFIGLANLLPLPPLDGGHLAVLAYEKIRRRDVDMRQLIPITVTVISVFGSLFLLLLYLDIVHPIPVGPG